MRAIHVISSAPFFADHSGAAYSMDKFELYCGALSALCRRRAGDEMYLAADGAAADYIENMGISGVWSKVLRVIPDDLEGINPQMFWAAGKLFALRETEAPVAMIDTDFILWKDPPLSGNFIVAAHRENLSPDVYPPLDYFRFKKPFSMKGMDERALPMNTAFLYLPDEDFKQYYVNRSIAFMKSAADCGDRLCYMVFAEQRLLSICAEELKVGSKTLMDKDELFFPRDDFTHLWGAKRIMRGDAGAANDFCERARKRIRTDFPDHEYIIPLIESSGWENRR